MRSFFTPNKFVSAKLKGLSQERSEPQEITPDYIEEDFTPEALLINGSLEEDEIAETKTAVDDSLPDCSEIGYVIVPDPGISFPCRGKDTKDLNRAQAKQRAMLDEGLDRAVHVHDEDQDETEQ